MTADQLIEEGRRLQRRTVLLAPAATGECAAIWFGRDHTDGCLLAVNTALIPSCTAAGWLSVYLDRAEGGRVELAPEPPPLAGTHLGATDIAVLPPIDAVMACGSSAVDAWLAVHRWNRTWGYNPNFGDPQPVEAYEGIYQREHPLYQRGSTATLGGWHLPWPDGDWHDLIDDKLLIQTYLDAEPYVEVWAASSGFRVVQRIT